MDYAAYIERIRTYTAAMRAAAEKAGPDAPVPSCPEWTVKDLVGHVAELQAWVEASLPVPPEGPAPDAPRPPAEWSALLAWWAERTEGMLAGMAATDPATRTWTFIPGLDADVGWFARRGAHDFAIHWLDAELVAQADIPALVYDTDFAADGIDELLSIIPPSPAPRAGTVLLHAADAGRAWLITLYEDKPFTIDTSPPEPTALDADAKVVGTADAVYRAMWGRPGHAVVSGDSTLVTTIKSF